MNKPHNLYKQFLEEWNKADSKQKEKLRKGLGYDIRFGQSDSLFH